MPPLLEIRDLSVRYRRHQKPVVNCLSWTIDKGDALLIVGPNGSGKSTIFKALSGDPSVEWSGSFRLKGVQMAAKPRKWRAAGVRWVPQIGGSFVNLSVRENLELIARYERTKIDSVLDVFPDLKTLLERQTQHISAGEQRMVDLALSILSKNVTVLWLDEPIAPLSTENADRYIQYLQAQIEEGVAVVMTSHRAPGSLEFKDTVHLDSDESMATTAA